MSDMQKPEHVKVLEQWMKSYRPAELFDGEGRLRRELSEIAPIGERRMSANPKTNGGLFLRDLGLPDFRAYAVNVATPGATTGNQLVSWAFSCVTSWRSTWSTKFSPFQS